MRLRRTTEDENARSALDCGSSSYRFPPLVNTANVQGKSGSFAAALQSALGISIFMTANRGTAHRIQAIRLEQFEKYT